MPFSKRKSSTSATMIFPISPMGRSIPREIPMRNVWMCLDNTEENLCYYDQSRFLEYRHNTYKKIIRPTSPLADSGFEGHCFSVYDKTARGERLCGAKSFLCLHCEALAKQWRWGVSNSRPKKVSGAVYKT